MENTTSYTQKLDIIKNLLQEIESLDGNLDLLTEKVALVNKLIAECRSYLHETEKTLEDSTQSTD